jgi:hypothetical protein
MRSQVPDILMWQFLDTGNCERRSEIRIGSYYIQDVIEMEIALEFIFIIK